MPSSGPDPADPVLNRILRGLSETCDLPSSAETGPPTLPVLPRYEVRTLLGEGATSSVYRVWDRTLGRDVALKVLRDTASLSPITIERFRREAQAAAGLSHPNVVRIYDSGEADGRHYLVMELVEGRSLREALKDPSLSLADRIALLERVGRGLEAAHAKQIVHRDVKPANIIVAAGNEPKVADFGLAYVTGPEAGLTRTGAALGTPLYMAPEQVEGKPGLITPATDVYALGAILYEILTGTTPHTGSTPAEIYRKILHDDPVPPRKSNPKAAPELEAIALKALEKEPRRRYPNAGEFAEDLRRVQAGEPSRAKPVSAVGRLWRLMVRRRAILLPIAVSVGLGLAAGIVLRRPNSAPDKVVFFERLEGEVRTTAEGAPFQARPGQVVAPGQSVETGAWPSRVVLRFGDGSRVELGPETSVDGIRVDRSKRIRVSRGAIRFEHVARGVEEEVHFETPHGQVRGAAQVLRLFVDSDPSKGTHVAAEEGQVELRDASGRSLVLEAGRHARMAEGADLRSDSLDLALDLGEGIRLEMRYIRPGTFTRGSSEAPGPAWQTDERPSHRVTITKGFYLGKHEVTRGQFAAFVKETGYSTEAETAGKAWSRSPSGAWTETSGLSWRSPGFRQTDDHPAACISWNDAQAFCAWATRKTGRTLALPTEAQWEYACRAGTESRWWFGDDESALAEHAWYEGNSGYATHPVGTRSPNPWGLFDLYGNVGEWCRDVAAPYGGDAVDPEGPESGNRRVVRGGGWNNAGTHARSAFRVRENPASRSAQAGFRLCLP